MANDPTVVFQGVLELGKESTVGSVSSRDWRSRLFVLRRDESTNISTLYMYKDPKKKWQKQNPKAAVKLHPTFQVSLAHTSGYQFPLQLSVADHPPLYLAASTYHLMNQWLFHLQTQRRLEDKFGTYTYQVEPQSASHASVIGANGECLLALTTDSEIICALAPSREVVGVWPFHCLRRYWCGEGVFGFEAGKRSPRGEGTFTFATAQDEEIYAQLKKYIDQAKQATLQAKRSSLTGAGAGGGGYQLDSRPKLPLPTNDFSGVGPTKGVMGLSNEEQVEEYAQVGTQQLVGRPRSTSPFQRQASLHHTDVSSPNPMYAIRRSNTAKPKRIQQWLEQAEAAIIREQGGGGGGAVGGADTSPPPPPPVVPRTTRDSSQTTAALAEEDMYSHTQHVFPAPFQRRATAHNIVEQSTYHTLVHDKCVPAHRQRRRASEGGGGGGKEDNEGLYDIAFEPRAAGVRQIHMATAPGDEYGTLDPNTMISLRTKPGGGGENPLVENGGERRKRNGGEEARKVVEPPALSDLQSPGFEDSMTENLMYNTRVEVFAGEKGEKVATERGGIEMTDGEEKREEEEEKVAEEGEKKEEEEEKVQEKSSGTQAKVGGVRGGATEDSTSLKEEDTEYSDEGGRRGGGGREGGGGGGGGAIQRDAKGYSKVDKSKKRKMEGQNEGEDPHPPPPLPPRLYEETEDELQLLQPSSPSSLHNGMTHVAVSDV